MYKIITIKDNKILMTDKLDICIPKVELHTKMDYIKRVFEKLRWGNIEKIVEIVHKNDKHSKRIIISMDWNNNEEMNAIKEKLRSGDKYNIVYDLPWYWKIVASKY
jgi:hypothetical protein|tara:strand:- start:23273 stop:23590 length:318 start_codon:yes stop_codon:yes gene_type:complete